MKQPTVERDSDVAAPTTAASPAMKFIFSVSQFEFL